MYDIDLLAKVAQLHALAGEIAAGITPETSGAVAVVALAEVLAAGRQIDLATVRLIERADRTGEYAADGASSGTAFVRRTANETSPWAAKRVHLGRALADQLPATAAAAGGHPLPAAAARRMACDADIIPAVYNSDSQQLDYGRGTRTVPTALARQINTRDGGCTFTACDRPPAMTEIHHRRRWTRHQGPTNEENLESLCSFHHHLVHEGGWTITVGDDPARTPWFHPPGGKPPQQGQRRNLLQRTYPSRT